MLFRSGIGELSLRLLSSSLLNPALTAAAAWSEFVILNLGLSECPLNELLGLPMPELSRRGRLSPFGLFSWLEVIDMVRGNGIIDGSVRDENEA